MLRDAVGLTRRMRSLLLHHDSALGVDEHAVAVSILARRDVIVVALLGRCDDSPARRPLKGDHRRQILEHGRVLRGERGGDAEDRVHQAEGARRQVVLDDQHIRHDHDLDQHEDEGDVLAWELEAGKGVCRQGAEDELPREPAAKAASDAGAEAQAGERVKSP